MRMYKINDFFSDSNTIYRIFYIHNGIYYLQKFMSTYIFDADEDFLTRFCHKTDIVCKEEVKEYFPPIRYIKTDKKITPFREGTDETVDLYQIMDINTGALGGWIEEYTNLEQSEDAWIEEDGYVYGSSKVENSIISFSTIADSTIKNMRIDDCTIVNSEVINEDESQLFELKGVNIKGNR